MEDSQLSNIIAIVSLFVSTIALITSLTFWNKSFRPIVSLAVETHNGGVESVTYNLVVLNSGCIPAKEITMRIVGDVTDCFGADCGEQSRSRWLKCFDESTNIHMLQNGSSTSCSFGYSKAEHQGFWKYGAQFEVSVSYKSWFNKTYSEVQKLIISDSESFTGGFWS